MNTENSDVTGLSHKINIKLTLEILNRFILVNCLIRDNRCYKIHLSFTDTPVNDTDFLGLRDEIMSLLKGEKKHLYLFELNCNNKELMVYKKLMTVPWGSTITYKELSISEIGLTPRVVGNILSRNPLPLVIPCHRVIGRDNSLRGYAFGLEMKRLLLEWEKSL